MKRILLLVFIVFLSTIANAQDKQPPRGGGRMEALKIAFITNKLNLTTEEAQKFWPIYNKYTAEIKQVYQNRTADEVELEAKVVEIRKNYKTQFLKVLSEEKVNQFFKADKEFNTMAQREMMERRQNRDQKKPV